MTGWELAGRDSRRGAELVDNDVAAVTARLGHHGWTDGLPVWPPLRDRVDELAAATGRDPDEVVALLPPSLDAATVELLAANAAMAGCPPGAMRVLLAAIEAIAEPPFNLVGIQATTHPCGILVLAGGPEAIRAGIAGGEGCLGPGVGSNVAVGRAVRLALMNIGGARPGTTDRSTHGSPAKISGCFTETLAVSPWPPLAVDVGWAPEPSTSTVTVFGAEGPHNIQDHASLTAAGVLDTVGGALRSVGANNFIMSLNSLREPDPSAWRPQPLVVLGPEHAATVASGGYDRQAVCEELWQRAHVPIDQVPREWRAGLEGVSSVPISPRPEDILVAVAGGPGKHSCWFPSMGSTNVVTRVIGP